MTCVYVNLNACANVMRPHIGSMSGLTSKRVVVPTSDVVRAPWEKVPSLAGEKVAAPAQEEEMDMFNMISLVLGMVGYFFKVGAVNSPPAVYPHTTQNKLIVLAHASLI